MAEQIIERPSVTQGNIAAMKATLTRDNEAFPVADAEDVAIALVSGLGRKTVISPEDYEISMTEEGVIYVDGPATLAPGCYGLEVTGTLNDTPWRTYTPSALVVTYPTVAGGGTATATGDRIDITMNVQMYAMSMRTMEGIQAAIDECEAAAGGANDAAQAAENVDAELNGTLLKVTNRQGVSKTVDTKGEKGDAGAGVAQGGSTGQVLVKKSNTDYDTEWKDAPASGVSSVNGKSGAVTLGAEDVGALPAGTPIPDAQVQSDWNEQDNTKVEYIKNKPTIPTVPTNVSSFNNDAGYITKSVDDLVNYYLKNDVYTKTEVANLIAAIQQFHYEIYASISAVTTPAGNVLYLIGPTGTGSDKYEEYVYDSTKQEPWVKIGDTSIDLSGYVTTSELNTALADYTTTAALTLLLAGKQDVINDLSDIRSGAAAGATAYQKPQGGIPSSDMSQGVQASLGKADTALQHQDISGKEDRTAIAATSTASGVLNTEVGKYHRIDAAVGTLIINLPAMTDLTTARTVVIYLTAGTTPAVTIAAADNKSVYYQDGFEIEAGNTYEINALFNGAAWIVASVEIVVPEVEEEEEEGGE